MMNIRTGNISYTVTNNNADKFIVIAYTNYKWRYNIELESNYIKLCLYVDKDNYIEDKREHIRFAAQNCTTIYQLRDLRVHKYSFTRQLLDKLYNEIKNKWSVIDIPEEQKTEFDNKIIHDYIDLWNYITS